MKKSVQEPRAKPTSNSLLASLYNSRGNSWDALRVSRRPIPVLVGLGESTSPPVANRRTGFLKHVKLRRDSLPSQAAVDLRGISLP